LTLQRSTNLENLLGIGHSFIAYRANRPQGVGGIFPYPAKWQPMGAGKRFYLPKFFRLLFSFARLPIVAKLAVPIGTWGFRTMPILETRGECGEARRGLGVGCADSEWPRRIFKP